MDNNAKAQRCAPHRPSHRLPVIPIQTTAPALSARSPWQAQLRMLRQGSLLAVPATFLGYTLLFVALVSLRRFAPAANGARLVP